MIEIFLTENDEFRQIEKPEKGSWINVVSPNDEEVKMLKEIAPLSEDFFVSLKDVNEMPAFEATENFIFIITRTPQKIAEGEEKGYVTIPLGIFANNDYFITICYFQNDVVRTFKTKKVDTYKRIINILKLLLACSEVYTLYLKDLSKDIQLTQIELEKNLANEDIIKMMNIAKYLLYFNTALKANQFLIEKITKKDTLTRSFYEKDLIEDIIEENTQSAEMVNIYIGILHELTNGFSSVIANNLNKVMKFLTSITIILMLPTLIASIYGMNVELPFQKFPHAFLITMVIAFGISFLSAFIFWKRKLF